MKRFGFFLMIVVLSNFLFSNIFAGKYYRDEQGNLYYRKSRAGRTIGYGLLGAGLGAGVGAGFGAAAGSAGPVYSW